MPVASSSREDEAHHDCGHKEKEPEVLEITLCLPEAYPPSSQIMVALPIIPICLGSPPSDEGGYESSEPGGDGKGKKGGPSVPQGVQDANSIVNTSAGPIPELVGARFLNGEWERDNSFWGMLSRNYWYDAQDNVVYPGALTHKVFVWDQNGRVGPHLAPTRKWIQWAPRGMPRSINECKNLLHKVITNGMESKKECFEAWLMLAEFYYIANLFAPTNRDHSITWAARNLRLRRPGPWITFPLIPLDPTILGSNNARIPDPEPSQALDIDAWAQLILHHGQPETRNTFHRIIFDRAFRVSRRSVWRYLLG